MKEITIKVDDDFADALVDATEFNRYILAVSYMKIDEDGEKRVSIYQTRFFPRDDIYPAIEDWHNLVTKDDPSLGVEKQMKNMADGEWQ